MIDDTRHRAVFDAARFNPTPIHVIGCGGPGSHIAMRAVRYGIHNVHVYDPDVIEPHNLANQVYTRACINKTKVYGLSVEARRVTPVAAIVPERVHMTAARTADLAGVVFIAPDTMAARKDLVDGLRGSVLVPCCIDVRMDAFYVRLTAFDPSDERDLELWDHGWYPDDQADNETDGCGAPITLGHTAAIAGEFAFSVFVHWWRFMEGHESTPPPNELTLNLRTYESSPRWW